MTVTTTTIGTMTMTTTMIMATDMVTTMTMTTEAAGTGIVDQTQLSNRKGHRLRAVALSACNSKGFIYDDYGSNP
jgi:hypothetical protein